MSFFSKRISDREWLDGVVPLYEAARPLMIALSEAARNDLVEDQLRPVQDVLQQLPIIADRMKAFPGPTSSDARQADHDLQVALRDYIRAAKEGDRLFRKLAGKVGQRLQWGGLAGRLEGASVVAQKTMFEEIVKAAEKSMSKAAPFFSSR